MTASGVSILLGLLLVGVVVFVLDRLLLWMEARGWIYWRRTKKRTGGSMGNALLEVHTLLEPGARNVLESRRRDDADEEAAGGPPEPGEEDL